MTDDLPTPEVDGTELRRAYRSEPVSGTEACKEAMLRLARDAAKAAGWPWEAWRSWIDRRILTGNPRVEITAPKVYRMIRKDFILN